MFEKLQSFVQGVLRNVFRGGEVKRGLRMDLAISTQMETAIQLWADMFQDAAPWLDRNTQSLGLPAAIAGELARLVTVEVSSEIDGSARASYLQEAYAPVLDGLRVNVELALSGGGLVFKPHWDGERLAVDCVPAWRFAPTGHNSRGELTGAAFYDQVQKGRQFYTRVELHELTGTGYNIRNSAFCACSANEIGTPCALSAVPEWAELTPEMTITQKNGKAIDRVLFAYCKLPFANNVDGASPLGVSAYSRAVGLIEQADKQYSRILWEYEGSELAIDASIGALRKDDPALPARRQRLFRGLNLDGKGDGGLYEVFSPAIRDGALFHGLDQLLKRIEFNCYLSYGTLSDPQSVEKTAEEIKTSKQRSYSAVCDIQKSLQRALEHLVWAMDLYATLYHLAPAGAYEVGFTWGDGVMENTETEFARRKLMADSGYLKPELLLAWYFGISEEEAKAYMPAPTKPTALFEEE